MIPRKRTTGSADNSLLNSASLTINRRFGWLSDRLGNRVQLNLAND